jgi:hypothetical protein
MEASWIARGMRPPAWATVTPAILPGHDERRGRRVVALIRQAIRQAGYPEDLALHADLEWRGVGFWPGTEPAGRYACPEKLGRFSRVHLRITWRDRAGRSTSPAPSASAAGGSAGSACSRPPDERCPRVAWREHSGARDRDADVPWQFGPYFPRPGPLVLRNPPAANRERASKLRGVRDPCKSARPNASRRSPRQGDRIGWRAPRGSRKMASIRRLDRQIGRRGYSVASSHGPIEVDSGSATSSGSSSWPARSSAPRRIARRPRTWP